MVKTGLKIERGIRDDVHRLIVKERNRKENFGNARGVRNIIESVKNNMQARVVKEISEGGNLTDNDLITIKKSDLFI